MPGREAAIRGLWPRTRGARIATIFVVLAFFAPDMLAIIESPLAMVLLVSLSGILAGAGRVVAYPFQKRFAGSGVGRTLGLFLGLAAVFIIMFAGSALADVPAYPTAEGGKVGALIYGLTCGSVPLVAGTSVVLFAPYVLIEYVLAPPTWLRAG